jgi:hypothetical protein
MPAAVHSMNRVEEEGSSSDDDDEAPQGPKWKVTPSSPPTSHRSADRCGRRSV